MNRPILSIAVLLLATACHAAGHPLAQKNAPSPASSDVVWNSPSENSLGSMPLGNGDLGANVWVEPSGDLVLLLSKTDAFDDFSRLLKVGRVRLKTTPALVQAGQPFEQRLNLQDGCIDIRAGATFVRVWIDAHHPVVQVDIHSASPIHAEAAVEIWRTETRMLDRKQGRETESHSTYGNFPEKLKVHPDVVLPHDPSSIAWCHHNLESQWERNLRHTGLEAEIPDHTDPILGRTFGAHIRGTGMKPASNLVLKSASPETDRSIQITLLTQFADSPAEWHRAVAELADQTPADSAARFAAHRAWWHAFWNRSWVSISGGKTGAFADIVNQHPWRVTQAYALQRFINACAGRGNLPIKFNGTLFTVDEVFDPDYRRWGGPYWLQNTRLPYWSMLASGDYEMMLPLFRMCLEVLPLRQAATKTYFGHDGAYYPETFHFWGNYADANYGFNRGDLPPGITENRYIRRHWVGIIEIVGMMLDTYHATQDEAFRDTMLIPLAAETFRFYDQHWQRGDDGKILYSPSQSLETYFETVNPTPDIASMRYLIPRLLKLPIPESLRTEWERQLADQPLLPMTTEDEKARILPAQEFGQATNVENPELYAVFPFRLFTLATASKEELQTAINSYHARRNRANQGWQQGPIWAALLGLTREAQTAVVDRVRSNAQGYRFPGFYGPYYDWTPDQDHISVFQTALQLMLMQCEGDQILLLPAWPPEWDVHFKLHAPKNTTVECEVKDGRIVNLVVTPASRRGAVTILPPFDNPAK
jgi:alpha-L-fucosidase 2